METSQVHDWKERAKEAFGRYLEALERDLPKDAGVAEIETAMLAHYQAMMSETMQALADSRSFSPRATKRTT